MNFMPLILPAATHYVSNDVGLTGGTGTQGDPYGLNTAIAAGTPGRVYYWRRNGVDLSGTGLFFNVGGASSGAGSIWWIGTDDSWAPLAWPNRGPVVDGGGSGDLVTITGGWQNFLNIKFQGAGFARTLVNNAATRINIFNCEASEVVQAPIYGFECLGEFSTYVGCDSINTLQGFRLSIGSTIAYARVIDAMDAGVHIQSRGAVLLSSGFSNCPYGINSAFSAERNEPIVVANCTFRGCGTTGIWLKMGSANHAFPIVIANNLFANTGGYCLDFVYQTGVAAQVLNNASFAATSGLITPSSMQSIVQSDWHVIQKDPFENPAPDFTLAQDAEVRGIGVDLADIGKAQRDFFRYPVGA